MTIVPVEEIMNKTVHGRNAFLYTCWGAHPVKAAKNELKSDIFGFSFIGSDGEAHGFKKGYYTMQVTIPTVIQDGAYVLGWAWYGGTGTPVRGNEQQRPDKWGYFGDYWSCSFIHISGGGPVQRSFQPTFRNDMAKYSKEGCMSANDALGVCAKEPCYDIGS